MVLNSNGITTTINNANDAVLSAASGIKVQDNTSTVYSGITPNAHFTMDAGGNVVANLGKNILGNYGMLSLWDNTVGAGRIFVDSKFLRIQIGTGLNPHQVVGIRRTGWTAWTGTATRTGFATSTATLQNVAETLKAVIDDLHATAGHGLLGT